MPSLTDQLESSTPVDSDETFDPRLAPAVIVTLLIVLLMLLAPVL